MIVKLHFKLITNFSRASILVIFLCSFLCVCFDVFVCPSRKLAQFLPRAFFSRGESAAGYTRFAQCNFHPRRRGCLLVFSRSVFFRFVFVARLQLAGSFVSLTMLSASWIYLPDFNVRAIKYLFCSQIFFIPDEKLCWKKKEATRNENQIVKEIELKKIVLWNMLVLMNFSAFFNFSNQKEKEKINLR